MGATDDSDNIKSFPEPEAPPPFGQSSKSYEMEKRDSDGSAGEPPPALDDNAIAGPSEPPPEFAPYEPSISIKDMGDIISHDHHLNEDGEHLTPLPFNLTSLRMNYRRSIVQIPPIPCLHSS